MGLQKSTGFRKPCRSFISCFTGKDTKRVEDIHRSRSETSLRFLSTTATRCNCPASAEAAICGTVCGICTRACERRVHNTGPKRLDFFPDVSVNPVSGTPNDEQTHKAVMTVEDSDLRPFAFTRRYWVQRRHALNARLFHLLNQTGMHSA